ncbi:MAG: NAD(P)H-dependent oxidoreductase [Oscillospiraceae bacterium]|nr:NAD(P)H-dependent oxidoreductase [Oscillospiraceae bacterium]
MKKRIFSVFIVSSILLLSACGDNAPEVPSERHSANVTSDIMSTETEEQAEETVTENKVLIAYFSWAENAVQDNIDAMTSASVKSPGNVAQLAQWIENETGGDLFSIQVTEPYPADWDGCLTRANEEKADGTHPALSETLENISEYDTVFLGYPNWWYSCPMAIFSFIDTHDLSDKNIYLFCSHGTGGLAGSVRDIAAVLPESAVVSDNVFHVFEDDTAGAREDLQEWLNGIVN